MVYPDPELAVVVVNWNGGELLRRCLASLGAAPPSCSWEVVVVDNASTDGSAEWLGSPEAARAVDPAALRVIRNQENRGFSRANNQAFAATTSRLLFLLNADAEVRPGTLDALRSCLAARPRVGLCGPRTLNPDGTLQPSTGRNPQLAWEILVWGFRLYKVLPRRLAGEWLLSDLWDHRRRRAVGYISGSAMLVRREVIDAIGGLDERFHMYCEDAEWCLRMIRGGWELVFEPDAVVVHHGQAFALQRWSDGERRLVAQRSTLLCWEIGYSRRTAIANSLASCVVLGMFALGRVLRRRPTRDLRELLAMHRAFLSRMARERTR